ncbi:mitochondrial import receptor subunit TOM22 homolog isoform X2 [Tachypleus tridentatus]|uniref:mitochondrial import receptor subunit TOM22 homolog isoform X2 n=1 Tax=Tachypleus tridentatus TaxID=6853 RepID=UPI003FD3423D
MAGTVGCVKWCYGFSQSAFWIFFSSSAILVAPVIFEIERMQMEEMQKQQQTGQSRTSLGAESMSQSKFEYNSCCDL